MLRTLRRPAGTVHAAALANTAVSAMNDCFASTTAVEQILRMLNSLSLGRMLRVSRMSARLDDLPDSF
jgi:hypothetical protein